MFGSMSGRVGDGNDDLNADSQSRLEVSASRTGPCWKTTRDTDTEATTTTFEEVRRYDTKGADAGRRQGPYTEPYSFWSTTKGQGGKGGLDCRVAISWDTTHA